VLYCGKCGSGITLDCSEGVLVLASAGLSSRKFSVGSITLQTIKKVIRPRFWCLTCNTEVTREGIVMSCSQCGRNLTLKTGYLIPGSGGVYCAEHAEALSPTKSFVSVDASTLNLVIG
jgi:hypothetical protein